MQTSPVHTGTPPPGGLLAMFASGAVLTVKAYRRDGRRVLRLKAQR